MAEGTYPSVRKRLTGVGVVRTFAGTVFPVLLFIIVGVGIGLVLLTVGSLVAPDRPDPEKPSPYECGFEAFETRA